MSHPEKIRPSAAERENEKAARQRVRKSETRTATIDTELAALEAQLAAAKQALENCLDVTDPVLDGAIVNPIVVA